MFAKLFRGCKDESGPKTSAHKLKQALEKLEEKEIVLQKKISIEVERAKEFTKAKNKQAALQCLKRKKFYEVQVEHIGSFQLRIHDQLGRSKNYLISRQFIAESCKGCRAKTARGKATLLEVKTLTLSKLVTNLEEWGVLEADGGRR